MVEEEVCWEKDGKIDKLLGEEKLSRSACSKFLDTISILPCHRPIPNKTYNTHKCIRYINALCIWIHFMNTIKRNVHTRLYISNPYIIYIIDIYICIFTYVEWKCIYRSPKEGQGVHTYLDFSFLRPKSRSVVYWKSYIGIKWIFFIKLYRRT